MKISERKTELQILFYITAFAHLLAAFNQISTHHPDEWFQTVELGNYISRGFISQTLEFHLHMRNLTWPAMLAAPLWVSSKLFHDSVFANFLVVKFTTAFLDLTAIACWFYIFRKTLNIFWRRVGAVLLILPVFWVSEWVRPSQEHLSAIALAWAFAAFIKNQEQPHKHWAFLAGAAAALCGVFRYPSGLLSAGFLVGILISDFFKFKKTSLLWLCFGAGAALIIGGLADTFVWGHPYESLWMYLQYNVFTGLSSKNFGTQSAYEYWYFWKSQWAGVWLPVALVLIFGNIITLLKHPKSVTPAVYTLFIYIIGHLLISHKEPRFMTPIVALTVWNGLMGLQELSKNAYFHKFFERAQQRLLTPMTRRFSWACAISFLAVSGLFWLRALWGETWRPSDNYLEVSRHARAQNACAVITVRRPVSSLLETQVATAFFPAPSHQSSWKYIQKKPLIWLASANSKPTPVTPENASNFDALAMACDKERENILIQPQQPEAEWIEKGGCTLLSSGILKFLPETLWKQAIDRKIVSGVWYSCPPKILSQFSKQEVRHMIATEHRRFKKLPRYGVTAEDLMKLSEAPGTDSTFADQ